MRQKYALKDVHKQKLAHQHLMIKKEEQQLQQVIEASLQDFQHSTTGIGVGVASFESQLTEEVTNNNYDFSLKLKKSLSDLQSVDKHVSFAQQQEEKRLVQRQIRETD